MQPHRPRGVICRVFWIQHSHIPLSIVVCAVILCTSSPLHLIHSSQGKMSFSFVLASPSWFLSENANCQICVSCSAANICHSTFSAGLLMAEKCWMWIHRVSCPTWQKWTNDCLIKFVQIFIVFVLGNSFDARHRRTTKAGCHCRRTFLSLHATSAGLADPKRHRNTSSHKNNKRNCFARNVHTRPNGSQNTKNEPQSLSSTSLPSADV